MLITQNMKKSCATNLYSQHMMFDIFSKSILKISNLPQFAIVKSLQLHFYMDCFK